MNALHTPELPTEAIAAAVAAHADRVARGWAVLQAVCDPEVPVLSLVDLGIVRGVEPVGAGAGLCVTLTPTYSGCPATEAIKRSVVLALEAAQLGPVQVRLQRAPAWTTDWISDAGRDQLRAYGIAPPGRCGSTGSDPSASVQPITLHRRASAAAASGAVACPRCDSPRTERLAAFGSTACKALYRCLACREPFEHFKPI